MIILQRCPAATILNSESKIRITGKTPTAGNVKDVKTSIPIK